MKRIVSVFLTLILLCMTSMQFATAKEPSAWSKKDIDYLTNLNLLDERMIGRYQSPITRADFAYLAVLIHEIITGKKASVGEASFPDTSDPYILKAKNIGIVNGYPSGNFAPKNYISRQEIAKLFVLSLQKAGIELKEEKSFTFSDDNDIMTWAKIYVYTAYAENIINGVEENKFNPDAYATREQALIIFKRIIDQYAGLEAVEKPSNNKELEIGTLAPIFNLKIEDNKTLALSDYSGQTVVLLFITPNFDICQEQMDIVSEIQPKYSNVNFLVFNIANQGKNEKRIDKKYKSLAVFIGDDKISELYRIESVPTTVIIDGSGKLVYYGSGKIPGEQLESLLKDL